jgi:predicted metal-dependent peptidase
MMVNGQMAEHRLCGHALVPQALARDSNAYLRRRSVQRVFPFRGTLKEVWGRGGTDLRPPFDQRLLAKVKPDVIICFTDGCGPAPDRPPRVPVIWCLTLGGRKPTDWGREVFLPEPGSA